MESFYYPKFLFLAAIILGETFFDTFLQQFTIGKYEAGAEADVNITEHGFRAERKLKFRGIFACFLSNYFSK